jgi:hypothetical protein
MSFTSDQLGIRYNSLDEAKSFRKENELIITDNNGASYYSVTKEDYYNGPFQLGYEVVKEES